MLALLIACLASLSPLVGGLIDAQSSSLAFALVAVALGIWALIQIVSGQIPLPGAKESIWALLLTALSGVSARVALIPDMAGPAWRTLLLGLWIFPLASLLSPKERRTVESALVLTTWILVSIALLELLFLAHFLFVSLQGIPSSFPNPNIFAGFLILMLPLALEKREHPLSLAILLCLLFARSLGAWLGLAAAAFLLNHEKVLARPWSRRTAKALVIIFALALMWKIRLPNFPNRWLWWRAAFKLFLERPWLGCGPGVFAYLLPLELPAHFLKSLYAHQYYLQTAAECGAPYLLIFLVGVFLFLPKSPLRRLAVLAALICGLWDYSLGVPAVFYLFCYIAASERPQSPRFMTISSPMKPLYALAVLLITWAAAKPAWARWNEERLKAEGISLFNRHAPIAEVRQKFLQSLLWAPDADVERLVAEIDFRAYQEKSPHSQLELSSAIRHWKKAAQENPCRASNWKALSSLEQISGNYAEAQRASLKALHLPCP